MEIRDSRHKEWFWLDNEYLNGYAKHLGMSCTVVYLSLCRHANNQTQKCFPSMDLIAEENGISKDTVIRAVKKLEEWNIISVQRGKNVLGQQENNVYTLLAKNEWNEKPSRNMLPGNPGRKNTETRVAPSYCNYTNNNNTYLEKNLEKNEFLGFPLPENWSDNSYVDSDGNFNPIFQNEYGQNIKLAEIKALRKKYETTLKAQKTRDTTSEFSKRAIKILQEKQNIYKLDGGDNLKHAEDFKKSFINHLETEMNYTYSTDEDLLKQYSKFLDLVVQHPFHGKNATSMGYLARNINKITREIN